MGIVGRGCGEERKRTTLVYPGAERRGISLAMTVDQDTIDAMVAAGIHFIVEAAAPWGGMTLTVRADEVPGIVADRDKGIADHLGVLKSQYLDWLETEGLAALRRHHREGRAVSQPSQRRDPAAARGVAAGGRRFLRRPWGESRSVVDLEPPTAAFGLRRPSNDDQASSGFLRKALRDHERCPPKIGGIWAQTISIIKLSRRGVGGSCLGERTTLVHAIHLRLVAMARLDDRPEMGFRGKEEGSSFIHDDVVVAASKAPLVQWTTTPSPATRMPCSRSCCGTGGMTEAREPTIPTGMPSVPR